jgi:hypothetical protein
MNVFQLIKTVLDELYARIPGSEAEKDAAMTERLRSLERGYAALAKGVVNDYADATTRFAYIYKYATCHANLVFQLIEQTPELMGLFDMEKVNVACIGGGPGSDFLGILKYVIRAAKHPHLRCTLFDKEESWGECWNDVDEKLGTEMKIATFFQPLDVTDPEKWTKYEKFLASDLFTMIFFMSEVNSLRKEAEPFFGNLFEKAKKGAVAVYVDNNNELFYGWFDSLVAAHGWVVLDHGEVKIQIEDYSEEKKDLASYYEKFGSPRLKANIAFRICQKQ